MEFFTSDMHFGHKNVIKFDSRPFSSMEEMEETIINNWNRKVNKDDTVYILGDISFYNNVKTTEIVSSLNGKKHIILGNHDKKNFDPSLFESVSSYKEIKYNGKKIVMCHFPIPFYNSQSSGGIMLHGHTHNNIRNDLLEKIKQDVKSSGMECNLYNVGTMMWNYEPVTLEEILSKNNK